jgi:hypothetical protein
MKNCYVHLSKKTREPRVRTQRNTGSANLETLMKFNSTFNIVIRSLTLLVFVHYESVNEAG